MDKTLSTILIIFALLLGAVCGAVIAPNEEVIKTVEKIVEIEKQVEVSVEVPSATAYLELAVEDFMKNCLHVAIMNMISMRFQLTEYTMIIL